MTFQRGDCSKTGKLNLTTAISGDRKPLLSPKSGGFNAYLPNLKQALNAHRLTNYLARDKIST